MLALFFLGMLGRHSVMIKNRVYKESILLIPMGNFVRSFNVIKMNGN